MPASMARCFKRKPGNSVKPAQVHQCQAGVEKNSAGGREGKRPWLSSSNSQGVEGELVARAIALRMMASAPAAVGWTPFVSDDVVLPWPCFLVALSVVPCPLRAGVAIVKSNQNEHKWPKTND